MYGTDEKRRRPVPLPASDAVRGIRGRAVRERNAARREADKRAVAAFVAAQYERGVQLAKACVASPEVFRWTCDACGGRYLERQLAGSLTPCCGVDARALSAADAMRLRTIIATE